MVGQARDKREEQNALSAYAANPDDPAALAGLAQHHPQAAIQVRQQQAQQEQAQKQAQRAQMMDMARLLESAKDPASYTAGLQAAQQLGLDVSKAPPQYDPQWVAQMHVITNAFLDHEDKLPGIAQELQAAGYKPGTPEFQQAMVGVINNKYASDYVDEAGNTRRRSALNLGGHPSQPQAQPQQPTQGGQPVQITGTDDYARLPPGATFIDPDGQIRTKAGGPTPQASGGF